MHRIACCIAMVCSLNAAPVAFSKPLPVDDHLPSDEGMDSDTLATPEITVEERLSQDRQRIDAVNTKYSFDRAHHATKKQLSADKKATAAAKARLTADKKLF